MTYLDPVADAARHHDALADQSEAANRAEVLAAEAFMAAARQCDANMLCAWAGMVTDWANTPRPFDVSKPAPKRFQTMTEVLAESLDYTDGPDMSEAMQLLMNVAYGNDLVNQPAMARALLRRMAAAWATTNADSSAWGA